VAETNPNSRLEAFCDGVFAIALTLLIIDIRIPSTEIIRNTPDFWLALRHIAPSLFAFILSFAVILITWVNHQAALKLVNKTSSLFIYANGFLLLTVVFVPFPTALLGEYLPTDHSSPAVVLYSSVLALQAVGWILISGAALSTGLTRNEGAILAMRKNRSYGYVAFAVYTVSSIVAFWFPLTIAISTTIIWGFWLILGVSLSSE